MIATCSVLIICAFSFPQIKVFLGLLSIVLRSIFCVMGMFWQIFLRGQRLRA